MSIDWVGRIGHITTPPDQIRAIDKIAALLLGSGEYVGNDHSNRVSHLVPSVNELEFGNQAAAVCGQLVSGADLFPDYDWCAECVAEDEPDIGQIEPHWHERCDDMNCPDHGVAASNQRQSDFFAKRGR